MRLPEESHKPPILETIEGNCNNSECEECEEDEEK